MIKKLFGNIPDEPITREDLEEEIKNDQIPERIQGKIVHINAEKGYGFINSHEIPFTRIFFHWTGLFPDTFHFLELKKGMEVEFTATETEDRGFKAIRIKVIE